MRTIACIVAGPWPGHTTAIRSSNSWQLLAQPPFQSPPSPPAPIHINYIRCYMMLPNSLPILLALQFFAFSISRVLIAPWIRCRCCLCCCSSSLDTNQNRIPHGAAFHLPSSLSATSSSSWWSLSFPFLRNDVKRFWWLHFVAFLFASLVLVFVLGQRVASKS